MNKVRILLNILSTLVIFLKGSIINLVVFFIFIASFWYIARNCYSIYSKTFKNRNGNVKQEHVVVGDKNITQNDNITTGEKSTVIINKEVKVPISNEDNKQRNIKIAKVKINRIIEDANPWLEEKIEQNKLETDRIMNDFNKHGVARSGMHVVAQIKRTNVFLKSVNDYIKELSRKIEDLLISAEEDKFENVSWLKDEHHKYLEFIKASKLAKDNIKQQNNELCSRFTDESRFNAILKENPYKE